MLTTSTSTVTDTQTLAAVPDYLETIADRLEAGWAKLPAYNPYVDDGGESRAVRQRLANTYALQATMRLLPVARDPRLTGSRLGEVVAQNAPDDVHSTRTYLCFFAALCRHVGICSHDMETVGFHYVDVVRALAVELRKFGFDEPPEVLLKDLAEANRTEVCASTEDVAEADSTSPATDRESGGQELVVAVSIVEIEKRTPMIDNSEDWISNKTAASALKIDTETLANRRYKGRVLEVEGSQFGIDTHGNCWRKDGKKHPRYYLPSMRELTGHFRKILEEHPS